MSYELLNNNRVELYGEIESELVYSHELYGEGFYEFKIGVNRLSENKDFIPVTISERLIPKNGFKLKDKIGIKGQLRSFNKFIDNKSKLMLTVFVRELVDYTDEITPNIIELSGFLCKGPIFRTTPFNREISDLLIAVNRNYNKSDYIPAIAWGRNARFVKDARVGDKIFVSGRIQSREYQKKLENGEVEDRVAYEVSVSKLSVGDDIEIIEQPDVC